MKCLKCGKGLSTFSHGYYCSNKECSEYDREIFDYESYELYVNYYNIKEILTNIVDILAEGGCMNGAQYDDLIKKVGNIE